MRILAAKWFWGATGVGCVLGVDETTGEHKVYIGAVHGLSQDSDEQFVADHGARVIDINVCKALFPAYKNEKWSKE